MSVHYTARPWETELFRRCRRAWDLAARERRNYEPARPARVFDFGAAIHEALDVYYFPGMWDWNRAIVRPLAIQGFEKSMRRQRDAYAQGQGQGLSQAQEHDWDQHLELGRHLLRRYFEWAGEVDRGFTPLQVAAQFDVAVPDPERPEVGLVTAEGRPLQFRVRIDLVVIDEHELYWLVEHRVVSGTQWPSLDQLLLDAQALTRSWAWQIGFLAKVTGTVHNELRLGASPAAGQSPDGARTRVGAAVLDDIPPLDDTPPLDEADIEVDVRARPGAGGIITQRSTQHFRRTQIPRPELEIERYGTAVALQLRDMIDPTVRIYPNPSWEYCSSCEYRPPCVAITQGLDEHPALDQSYRKRVREDFEPGRLGSVWGFVPEVHRVADYRGTNQQSRTQSTHRSEPDVANAGEDHHG